MAEANINESINRNKNTIIIAVAIVVLVVIFMIFRDRQQKRVFQFQQIDSQMDVWEEWGSQQQNRQPNNTRSKGGGKIL